MIHDCIAFFDDKSFQTWDTLCKSLKYKNSVWTCLWDKNSKKEENNFKNEA